MLQLLTHDRPVARFRAAWLVLSSSSLLISRNCLFACFDGFTRSGSIALGGHELVPETITSFAQYQKAIRRLVDSLPALSKFRFCVWCVDRFPAEFGDDIWDGLTPLQHA